MSKAKIVSTIVYLINFGVSSAIYYEGKEKHKKLIGAKAYWDKDKNICFKLNDKVYKFKLIEE